MKNIYLTTIFTLLTFAGFSQSKTIVGIMPFNSNESNYNRNQNQNQTKNIIAIQDAVSDAFLAAKRFTLVEREKMALIKGEKKTQMGEDYIDGQTVEQSKSMGASYIVTGNVTEALFEEKQSELSGIGGFSIPSRKAKISFNIKVIDVSTGEIMASEKFSAEGKGKNGYDEALDLVKPNIEKFIKDNFKITASIASIEEKNASNEAVKILISGGTGIGLKPQTTLKVFELTSLMVDGKKIPRKKEIGQIVVEKVEDENFSICNVVSGGAVITAKSESGSNLKCEIISQ